MAEVFVGHHQCARGLVQAPVQVDDAGEVVTDRQRGRAVDVEIQPLTAAGSFEMQVVVGSDHPGVGVYLCQVDDRLVEAVRPAAGLVDCVRDQPVNVNLEVCKVTQEHVGALQVAIRWHAVGTRSDIAHQIREVRKA